MTDSQHSLYQDMPSFPMVSLGLSDMPEFDLIEIEIDAAPRKEAYYGNDCMGEDFDPVRMRREMARAAGMEISEHEAARWTGTEEQKLLAASRAANIVFGHSRP